MTATPSSIGNSARASLLWGGGFTLFRDLAQFGTMLILVRLLTPADYGTAALAQAVIGIASVLSYAGFSAHTLQIRDPFTIDWQVHFTAAAVLNSVIAVLVLVLAFGLSFLEHYRQAALPVAVLAVVFLVEVPGTMRQRMLEVNHDWKRFRLIMIIGTVLGLAAGLAVAMMGGGVWALIVQMPLLGLPAAIDLMVIQRFKPDWTWSWARWRATFCFGLDRIGSALLGRGRVLNEQALLSGLYDLATLGIFSRAVGLATLLAGRTGSSAMMSLHPIITRAESNSARFRRLADLIIRGVVWLTLPAAAFLCIAARDTVQLLYGAEWSSVALLLPLAATAVGFGSIVVALSSLLVANDSSRVSLVLEGSFALSGIGVAVGLIPFGVWTYLAGLNLHALVFTIVALVLLVRRGAMSGSGVIYAFTPAFVSAVLALVSVFGLRRAVGISDYILVRLLLDAVVFGLCYVATLRFVFTLPLIELVEVAPGGTRAAKWMGLSR